MYEHLPTLGTGMAWRTEIAKQLADFREDVQWCEIISEHYMFVPQQKKAELRELARTWPLIPHGVDLSIGTAAGLDAAYLNELASLVDEVRPPWFSDHLCFTRVPERNLGQLGPLAFSEEIVEVVTRHAREIRGRITTPFIVENITYDFVVPGSEMTEVDFINRVLAHADVGMLLDVTNLFTNASNHAYDPYAFVDRLHRDRIVQLHLAGGHQVDGRWLDSHAYPVPAEVMRLTEYVLERAPVKAVLVERDANYPKDFREIQEELQHIRRMFDKHRESVMN